MYLVAMIIGLSFTYTPPDVGPAPLAPSNIAVKEVYGGLDVSWQDNSSDELGFYVYRGGQLLASTDQNVTKIYDKIDWYDRNKEYCYDVASFAPYIESTHTETKCIYYTASVAPPPDPNPQPQIDLSQSAGFDYPVAASAILSWENTIPNGAWYDYQPFGSLFNYATKVHLGADINLGGGDAGQRLFAVNDCVIKDYSDTTALDGWGKWLALQCEAPTGYTYRLPDGSELTKVYFLYAHLGVIEIHKDDGTVISASSITKGVTKVKKGWEIATVGNGNGYYGSAYHLHFECRKADIAFPGVGYKQYDSLDFLDSYINPIEFIANNRTLGQKVQKIVVHPYELTTSKNTYVSHDINWQRVGRTGTSLRQSMGYGNYLWVADTAKSPTASWNFKVPVSGKWEVYIYLPNSVATATQAEYKVSHSDTSFTNPFRLVINQSRNPGLNEKVYLGKFQFNSGSNYSVNLKGYSSETYRKIVLDALELVYYHPNGAGGGLVDQTDSDQDMVPDIWEIKYGLDPSNPTAMYIDSDQDGLDDRMEYLFGTNPIKADSDDDGVSDLEELRLLTDPNTPNECLDCSVTKDYVDDEANEPIRDNILDNPNPTTDTVDVGRNVNNIYIDNHATQNTGCSSGGDADIPLAIFITSIFFTWRLKKKTKK